LNFGSTYHKLSFKKCWSLQNKLSNLQLLVIDEISLISSDMLSCVEKQYIKDCTDPFGGVSILAVGDLFQLPPVCQTPVYGPVSDAVERLSNPLWEKFQLLELTDIMWQKEDRDFAEMLIRIRNGTQTNDDIQQLQKRNFV
jgi:hypothetical protein